MVQRDIFPRTNFAGIKCYQEACEIHFPLQEFYLFLFMS